MPRPVSQQDDSHREPWRNLLHARPHVDQEIDELVVREHGQSLSEVQVGVAIVCFVLGKLSTTR